MSSSNPYAQYYLAQEVKGRLGQLRYHNDLSVSTVEALKGLKEQILAGPVDLVIAHDNRFKVILKSEHYYEAICKRHYFGVRRMHRLCRSAERLAETKWATAWTLTTCYYAAYFAALELLNVTGNHVTYLSSSETVELTVRAKPSLFKVEAGVYSGLASYHEATDEVEVAYIRSRQKPHEFAWQQLKQLVNQTTTVNVEAVRHRATLLRLLGASAQHWSMPNEIRNLWNYIDPTLFCEKGESCGADLVDKIRSPRVAHDWGTRRHVHDSIQNEATGLAYLRAGLVDAVDQVANAVLPPNLAMKKAS